MPQNKAAFIRSVMPTGQERTRKQYSLYLSSASMLSFDSKWPLIARMFEFPQTARNSGEKMDDSELLIELQRRIDEDNLLVFNEETSELLTGADLKLSFNGSKLQITLDKKEILRTRNRLLRVIVLNLDAP